MFTVGCNYFFLCIAISACRSDLFQGIGIVFGDARSLLTCGAKRHIIDGRGKQVAEGPRKRRLEVHLITVLVADDNESFRGELVTYLRRQVAIKVIGEARNGVEAIELSHTLDPDVILMDISMPMMDGIQAARQLKERGTRSKIVFVSIHEESTYRELLATLDADGFVSKSSIWRDIPKVLRKIRAGLDRA